MKIAQITDIHISPDLPNKFGEDSGKNLEKIIESILNLPEKPDLLAITGDLCFKSPLKDIYAEVKSMLDKTEIDYCIIPGNHDDTKIIASVFGIEDKIKNNKLYYNIKEEDVNLIFIDSSPDNVSNEQLFWLKEQLESPENPFLFMHHPPFMANCKHMDSGFALKNMVEVQTVLKSVDKHIPIFVGHYHTEKTLKRDNITIHITPSVFFQINQDFKDFVQDKALRPAYRIIDIFNNGDYSSSVRFV